MLSFCGCGNGLYYLFLDQLLDILDGAHASLPGGIVNVLFGFARDGLVDNLLTFTHRRIAWCAAHRQLGEVGR